MARAGGLLYGRAMTRLAAALLLALAALGCGADPEPTEPDDAASEGTSGGEDEAPPAPRAYPVTIEGGSMLLPPEAAEDAKVTLVGPGGACVGQVMGGGERVLVTGCPLAPAPWLAIGADGPATLTRAERTAAPSLESGATYVGRFGAGGFGFRLESPEGDGLCPGAPTTITFLHGDGESLEGARVLGQTVVEAPITRGASEGVMALVRADGQLMALVIWGGDRRRLVTLEGTTLFEGQAAEAAPCDCCEG